MTPSTVVIDGESIHFADLRRIAMGTALQIPGEVKLKVERSRAVVKDRLSQGKPIYGVNTGFGYFARTPIDEEKLRSLQHNLLVSHACGHGQPLSIEETRVAMALRLNVLCKGFTGVRWELIQALEALIVAGIYPVVPEKGSVGASGDLAPLSHLALPLIGEGDVQYEGKVMPAAEALQAAGLQAIQLEPKEGLGLINGTQIMLAVGGLALERGQYLMRAADLTAALSYEALGARTCPLYAPLHRLRAQAGQITSASQIREALDGSYLWEPRSQDDESFRVQDPYSLRCSPQVHGASRDALGHSVRVVENELNAATDNPLVFADVNELISGGNFHGQPLALAFDIAALGLAELGNISERRLELMLNPHVSHLNAFLSPEEGTQSGYMAAQYLSASLVNENKLFANPACTDSIPGNVGIEDHVSMGMTSARKLRSLVENLRSILAVELLAAAQAIDLQSTLKLGRGTQSLYEGIRDVVPTLDKDRIIAKDVERLCAHFDDLFKGESYAVSC